MSIVPLINVTQSNHHFNRGKRKNLNTIKITVFEKWMKYAITFGLLRIHYVIALICVAMFLKIDLVLCKRHKCGYLKCVRIRIKLFCLQFCGKIKEGNFDFVISNTN